MSLIEIWTNYGDEKFTHKSQRSKQHRRAKNTINLLIKSMRSKSNERVRINESKLIKLSLSYEINSEGIWGS